MNEDGTTIVADPAEEPSTDNIPASEGGESTTPEEVAELLHLDKPVATTDDDEVEETDEEKEAREAEEAENARLAEEQEAKDKEASDKLAAEEEAKRVAAESGEDEPQKFELEVEDVNGEKFTLKPGDDLEEVLKDFEPKNNGQIFKIIDDLNQLRDAKKAFDAAEATKTQEAEAEKQLADINAGWDKEISALQGTKRIPVTTDGKQPERVTQVFEFMGKENDKRVEDGRPLLRSFEDALDKLELQESKDEQAKKDKEEKELARKRGGIVGGSSAPATNGPPVYRGGARNANEALRQVGLIK